MSGGGRGVSSFMAGASSISTQAELDQRMVERPEPAPEQHLTIEGSQGTEVRREVGDFNEARIKALESRFERVSSDLNHDFSRSRLEGKARTDFGHSR